MSYLELDPLKERVVIDTKQTYTAYQEAAMELAKYAGGMSWKNVGGKEYLIKIINRTGGNKSLGARSEVTENIYQQFVDGKARAAARAASLEASLKLFAGMARGVNVNRVPNIVTAMLRRLNEAGLLGKSILVIGTNALYGYESSAGVQLDSGLMATTDIDLLWDSRVKLKLGLLAMDIQESGILGLLRKVDKTFEPQRGNTFSAVNNAGFYVDMIKQQANPPWKEGEPERIGESDLTPVSLPNMKWLLSSEKFHSVVIGMDGYPAPMVAPDPRAFAVYKAWLSQQDDREPGKKRRDMLQSEAVIELVRNRFPHLPLDDNAERSFPAEVRRKIARN